MKQNTKAMLIVILTCIFSLSSAFACTNITIKAKDNSVVVGRTLEFGPDLNSNIITSLQGQHFAPASSNGKAGLSWTAKYGYIFMDFFGSGHPVDGMNTQGLSFGYLYLPGYAQYQTVPNNKDSQALSYIFLGDWILGNFSTVEEVKNAIKNIYVFVKPENFGTYSNMIFPLHAIVTDTSGKSITIEFVKGKMQVTDNVMGVLTNSPTYHWQLTNLKNYANLSPYSPKSITVDNIEYSGTGQGGGAVGLPGDYTPPSRFVKMSFLVANSFAVGNASQALTLAQHIINNVDIPNGVVRGVKGTNDPSDKTQWTVFKDLTNRILYFRSYDNLTLQAIHLNKINFTQSGKVLKMPVASSPMIVDSTERYSKKQAG